MTEKNTRFFRTRNYQNYTLVKPRKGGKIAIIRLLFKYYYKSFYGPFFNFIFPIILYLILSAFISSALVIPGMISMTTMSLGITGLPYSILELKNSVILKRMGAAPVKKGDFTITVVLFFIIQLVLSIAFLIFFAYLRHLDLNIFQGLSNLQSFVGFIYGNFLNSILSISIGFLIASISKTPNQANAISALVYFPASFLSGQFITIDVLATKPLMNYMSLVLPFRYTTMIITVSFAGSEFFSGNIFFYNDILMTNFGSLQSVIKELIDHNVEVFNKTLAQIIEIAKKNAIILPNPLESQGIYLLQPKLIYHAWEPIMAYVYPYFLTSFSLLISSQHFSWSTKR